MAYDLTWVEVAGHPNILYISILWRGQCDDLFEVTRAQEVLYACQSARLFFDSHAERECFSEDWKVIFE